MSRPHLPKSVPKVISKVSLKVKSKSESEKKVISQSDLTKTKVCITFPYTLARIQDFQLSGEH